MLSFSCNCNIWQLCIKCSSLTSITQLLLLLLPMQHISCLRSSKVDFIYRQPLHVSKDTANTFQNIYAGFKINLQTCTLIHHELHHFVVPIWSGSSFFKTCSNITDFLKNQFDKRAFVVAKPMLEHLTADHLWSLFFINSQRTLFCWTSR